MFAHSQLQYNILKVARHMFQWTASPTYFDFYERAMLNGLIGNQNRLDPLMTSFIYMLPLGPASHKPWGLSNDSFPCCWGTLAETFSKLTDSIYFQMPDSSGLFVNQYVSSSIQWDEQGVVITQSANFPETAATTAILISSSGSLLSMNNTWTMNIRIPFWAYTNRNFITINGEAAGGGYPYPGQYFSISRAWKDGDLVEVSLPMTLRAERLKDNRDRFKSLYAIMYGPVLLVGLTKSSRLVFDPSNVSASVIRSSTTELLFKANDVCHDSVVLMPLMDILLVLL